MRTPAIALLLTSAAAASSARAPTSPPTRIQRTYTADNVLSVLGKPTRPQPGRETMRFYDVSGGISTNVSCGQLRVNFDLNGIIDTAKRIPGQLAGQAQNMLGALPMLILCQSSPSLCAEIKNLNYQINEELSALSDTCRAMDSYIDGRAREGRARGWRDCVSRNYGGGNLANAQQLCDQSEPHPLYTDIARGWMEQRLTNAPQRVIGSLLTAMGENVASGVGQERYGFLSAILGEFTLDVNGNKLPVFPAQPLEVNELGKAVGLSAIELTCDTRQLARGANGQLPAPTDADAAVRDWKKGMLDVLKSEITLVDVGNLNVLDDANREVACTALGRAVARTTLRKLGAESRAIMERVLPNPALEPELRVALEAATRGATTALVNFKFEGADLGLEQTRQLIQAMADTTREKLRQGSAIESRSLLRVEKNMSKTPCVGVGSCE